MASHRAMRLKIKATHRSMAVKISNRATNSTMLLSNNNTPRTTAIHIKLHKAMGTKLLMHRSSSKVIVSRTLGAQS